MSQNKQNYKQTVYNVNFDKQSDKFCALLISCQQNSRNENLIKTGTLEELMYIDPNTIP